MKTVSAVKGIIPLFLLVIFARSLGASTIATAEVQADFGSQHCSQSSSGVLVYCNLYGPLSRFEAGSWAEAKAGPFSVYANANANTNPSVLASASATASATFDELVIADGSGTSILIGHYLVSFSALTSGQFSATIDQGDGQFRIQDEGSPIGGMITVLSHYTPGVPFEVRMSGLALASGPDQLYGLIEVDLINFSDQNGDPVLVTPIPEPGSFPIFALLLAICGLNFLR